MSLVKYCKPINLIVNSYCLKDAKRTCTILILDGLIDLYESLYQLVFICLYVMPHVTVKIAS